LEELDPARPGTLEWLARQPTVEVQGLTLPACHRVPQDATLGEPEARRCRVVQASGQRCGATPTRRYGLCLVHAGGGGILDKETARAFSRKGNARRATLRAQRSLLGIGARRSADPRQIARIHALSRAEEVAESLLSPLDDPELSSLKRQLAAVRILDAVAPHQTASLEVSLPLDPEGVEGLGWAEMQALAQRLAASQDVTTPEDLA